MHGLSCIGFCFLISLFIIASDFVQASEISINNGSSYRDIENRSWRDIRDSDIVKQQFDYSCGAASVATILQNFYKKDVSESDFLEKIEGDGLNISFSDLANGVEHFGFKGAGYALTFEKLKTLKIPAIVYLKYRDEDHFSVVRGVSNDGVVWLGDPSWGNRKFSQTQFLEMWDTRQETELVGKILLIVPQDIAFADIEQEFFSKPVMNNDAIDMLRTRQF